MMYYSYQRAQRMAGGEHLRYFTRILHRQEPDAVMDEIPTVRVEPLHPHCDTWCEFPVADRPNAVAQWLQTEDSRKGKFVLLIETDYIWTKPVPMPLRVCHSHPALAAAPV